MFIFRFVVMKGEEKFEWKLIYKIYDIKFIVERVNLDLKFKKKEIELGKRRGGFGWLRGYRLVVLWESLDKCKIMFYM